MSQLFEVEITIRSVVQAGDAQQAFVVARGSASEMVSELDALDCIDIGRTITEVSHLPQGWNGECLPYGGDGRTRIAQILAEQPPERDTKTVDMFATKTEAQS